MLQASGRVSAREHLIAPFDQISMQQSPRKRALSPELRERVNTYRQDTRATRSAQMQRKLAVLYGINDGCDELCPRGGKRLERYLGQVDGKYAVLRPESALLVFWNLLNLLAILLNLLEIVLSIFLTQNFYLSQKQDGRLIALNALMFAILAIDTCFVRFNLAYYDHGRLVDSRYRIMLTYLKGNFFCDLIALIAYLTYIAGNDYRFVYFKILFYLKFWTLVRIDKQLLLALNPLRLRLCLYRLARIILMLWFLTTWISSLYFAIDYHYYLQRGYYYQTGQLWLTNSNLVNNIDIVQSFPKWYIWYEYAVYWSLQVSSTVGYGNMTPRNPVQVLYCNICIVINTIFFAFYINSVWQIISGYGQEQYTRSWGALKQLMRGHKSQPGLMGRIAGYLKEVKKRESTLTREQELVGMLSGELRAELFGQMRGGYLEGVPVLGGIGCAGLLDAMEKLMVGPRELLHAIGDEPACCYFVVEGRILSENESLGMGTIYKEGECVGITQFIARQRRFVTAYTLTFSVLLKIDYSLFTQLIKHNPSHYHKYCQLRHEALVQGNAQLCNSKCIKCGSVEHFTLNCPLLQLWRGAISGRGEGGGHGCQERSYVTRRAVKSSRRCGGGLAGCRQAQVDVVSRYEQFYSQYNIY